MGESFIFLNIREQAIRGRLEITVSDLAKALRLDKDNDGKVSEAELHAEIEEVKLYVSERVHLAAGETSYEIDYTTHEIAADVLGQKYVVIEFIVAGLSQMPEALEVSYNVLFDIDPRHRGLLVVESRDETRTQEAIETISLIFTPDRQHQRLDLASSWRLEELSAYLVHGVWHIWIGIDHILFLVALLLPSVLRREAKSWQPIPSFRLAFIKVVTIVTLFTVAHSVTLSLAALQIVQLPSRFVESAIALSIAIAALNNLFPIYAHRIGWIVFGFGLFHGFGFASVLTHLGLREGSLALRLLGFNLGVEIGQVAVMTVAFPLVYSVRKVKFYPSLLLRFGSLILVLVALYWFVERAFDLELNVLPI